MLVLDVFAAGVVCEVDFNDIPLFDHESFVPAQQAAKVDNWAVSGTNELTVRIGKLPERGPKPPTGKPIPQSKVTVILRQTQPGADPASDRIVASYTWPVGQLPPPTLSTVWHHSADLGPRRPWSWLGATLSTSLSPTDRTEIMALLRQIVAALEARDRPRVIELQRLSISENAESMGLTASEVLGRFDEFLAERMGANWRVEPIAEAALSLRLAAGGRLVHAVAPDGRPAINTDSDAGYFGIDPWLAKMGGKWTMVR